MGERERRDSLKTLTGEKIIIKTQSTLKDLLLRPFRAVKYWHRQRQIRKNLFKD